MATVKIVHLVIDKWEDEWVGVAIDLAAAKRLVQREHDEAAQSRIGITPAKIKWQPMGGKKRSNRYWKSTNGPYDGYRIHTVTLHE